MDKLSNNRTGGALLATERARVDAVAAWSAEGKMRSCSSPLPGAEKQPVSVFAELPPDERWQGAPDRKRAVDFLAPGSLLAFMMWMLPLYMGCGIGDFQHGVAAKLEAALLTEGRFIGAMPREHGKTTLGTVGLLLFNACRCAAEAERRERRLATDLDARAVARLLEDMAEARQLDERLPHTSPLDGPPLDGERPDDATLRLYGLTPAKWDRVLQVRAADGAAWHDPKWHNLLIGATRPRAEEALALVKYELENNPLIKKYFPSAAEPARDNQGRTVAYRKSEIVLACGLRIAAAGACNPIRGALFHGRRPDLIILDDPEDDRRANSQKLRENMRAWCERALLPALDNARGSLVWLGTLLHHDSVLARWREEKGGSRQYAVDSRQQEGSEAERCIEPGSMRGETELEAGIPASSAAGQLSAASRLNAPSDLPSELPTAHCLLPTNLWDTIFLPAINDDGTPLWPQRWPLAALERRRLEIGDAAFNQEYLLRPVSAQAQRFREGEFQHYDPEQLEYKDGAWHIDGRQLTVAMGVDPAVAQGEHNDYFCAAVVGFTETEDAGRGADRSFEVLGARDWVLGEGRGAAAKEKPRPEGAPALTPNPYNLTPPAPQMRAYVLEVVRVKDRFQRQFEILHGLNRKWRPRVVGIENTAYQDVLCQMCAAHGMPVRGLPAGPPKAYRIEALSGTVAQQCWRVPTDGRWTRALYDEAYDWPCGRHDDQLDALARAQEVGLTLLPGHRRALDRGGLGDGALEAYGAVGNSQ